MFKTPEIHLLKGFCTVDFGAAIDTVTQTFGEPQEIQTLKEDLLGNNSVVYHYWDHGYSLFFDVNNNSAFCSVETDNRECLLYEMRLFSLREKEVIELMKENGFGHTDTEMHEWGEKRISFDAAGLDCYFENNRLVSVNFGVLETVSRFQYFAN
jgi:hypothetical protein